MISEKVFPLLEYQKVLEYIAKYTYTELGRGLILSSKPLVNIKETLQNGKFVSEAKEILIKNDIPPIESLPNLHEALSHSRITGSLLTIENIRSVKSLSIQSRKLSKFIEQYCKETTLFVEFASKLFVDKNFENEIEKVFDVSGEVKDSASSELKRIRVSINEKNHLLRKTVNRILKHLSKSLLVQEEYVTLRDGRVVLPIKAEHKRHVKGFIHSESATGQTIYIEPEESLELNNDLLSLHFAEKREIEKILKTITQKIGSHSFELKESLNTIGELDSIFAKAQYSIEIIGSFPSIINENKFEIIDGYHPILLKKLNRKNTVPLSLEIDSNRIIIITGPNAGGKTVVLKTVGLLSLLVISGIHVPVEADSNFRFFNNIFLDIGDQQSIEDDLSTFSSHLSNINEILKESDKDSLVLLDELGTGTDPTEGAALAASILYEFNKNKSIVLATTHHGDLKILANNKSGFQNASMEFNLKELKPTYRFKQGMPGSSYAFEVAKRIGVNEALIKTAKENIKDDSNRIEEFLIDLEQKTNKIRDKLNEYEIENSRLKGLANLYQTKIDKLEKDKRKIILDAKEKANELLEKVNREVEQTIKDIKEGNAERVVIKKAKQTIRNLKKESEVKTRIEEDRNLGNPKIGDYVKIKDTNTVGEIISINRNIAQILTGNIKVTAKLNSLELSKKPKVIKKNYAYSNLSLDAPNIRLDIRGNKPEEIEFEVIKFLDDAFSNNTDQVEIVHGKGTGVLKQTVHEILKNHSGVKDYNFAKIELGGEGVTIIKML
ncbi:MAG: endonuclease MutS2 [Melioribacteraceae bacterium]|nr:endonuclease MutS2 [Melioribacteraceae bacterium]